MAWLEFQVFEESHNHPSLVVCRVVTALSHLSKSVQTNERHCKLGVCSRSKLLRRQLIPFQSSSGTPLPSPPLLFPLRKSAIFLRGRPSQLRHIKLSTLGKIIIKDKICWRRSDKVFVIRKIQIDSAILNL